ncbi:para-aminobenzoate synthase, component I [Methylococcus capsulatus str. Bath]|jgi:para-aminobenzoate synthetase component 1|uniref:aminodeoxychorismate synthase n=1 Tax=Methylococcus capsulatus (strain ATCC 33009 / NCIMB 11132 / Bath) TaxID=243233 RepID=Q603D7_METCA|nr:aminodeoxychorismate synthase component I [Methylococcus capsulatus]AAU91085.1 para-aminobenzoate synthase, component I [Methylococcus capsulatus str. Bath]
MTPRITELPYFRDSAALFGPWADRRWAVFLDSGFPHCRHGRYDIIAADPLATLVTRGHISEIRRRGGEVALSPEDPFSLLRRELGTRADPVGELPFSGGAVGYFGYDLGRRLEKLPERAVDAENMADMAVGIYDWAVIVDHLQGRSWLVSQGRSPATAARWPHLVRSFSQIQTLGWQRTGFDVLAPVRANMNRRDYVAAFERIQHYIREGDCYQVNLAQRFAAPCRGSAWTLYQTLRQTNPAPFSAFINGPQARVLSSSPERFLRVLDGRVETKPIKGTRPRSTDPLEDRRQEETLRHSEKDRAENLMIVDLLRNDLGKHCQPGSVRVPKLFEIESYTTVHHLVSTVTGTLARGHDAIGLLRDSFPGGSITGAPKIRAMEIIEELEPHRRGVYCGAIGYVGFDGNMDTNIAIRTLVQSEGTVRFWAGGGIVADSSAASEYQECFDKAAALLNLLERFRIARTGDHVGR